MKRNYPIKCISPLVWFLAVMSIGCAGCGSKTQPTSERQTDATAGQPVVTFATAERKFKMGLFDEAQELTQRLMLQNDSDARTILLAARVADAKRQDAHVIDLAVEIGFDHDRFGTQAAELCLNASVRSEDVASQERTLQWLTESMPHNAKWNRQFAILLRHQGRLEQAARYIERLASTGDATAMELSQIVSRAKWLPTPIESAEPDPQVCVTAFAKAQWYRAAGKHATAERLIVEAFPDVESFNPEQAAFYLSVLAEQQKTDVFVRVASRLSEEAALYSDYWSAFGQVLIESRRFEAAAGCLLRCLQINPTVRLANQRLAMCMDAMGRHEDAEQFRYRGVALSKSERDASRVLSGEGSPQLGQSLARQTLELERPIEALQWRKLSLTPGSATMRQVLQQQEQLRADSRTALVAADSALMQLDPDDFSVDEAIAGLLDTVSSDAVSSDAVGATNERDAVTPLLAEPSFSEIAHQVNLDFQYYLGDEIKLDPIPMYAAFGSGIGVIDYDLDGWPDVYFAQAGCVPDQTPSKRSNELRRNIEGRFKDRTSLSGLTDRLYSTGVTVGDINQDGFPDLYVGAFGENQILVNQGDGTFVNQTSDVKVDGDYFTTSVAIADMDADALPDLVEVNYVESEAALEPMKKTRDGKWIQQMPLLYLGAADRVAFAGADGKFAGTRIGEDVVEPATGLGIIIADFDSDGQNKIFVGNDARANHLLSFDLKTRRFQNSADSVGSSLGFSGAATACMGIATGDFDRSGSLDMHITNYTKEPANLYLQSDSHTFQDAAVRYQLSDSSTPMVGFGTKAIDLDRNGWLDLLVTNGHVFDQTDQGDAFRMPFQMFLSDGKRFHLSEFDNPSGYLREHHLGRSMVSIDFDRDRDTDFLVGHLDEPTALLRNETTTTGQSIRVSLVGTVSERDAIGARVMVRLASYESVHFVTAGDGYYCSDEPVLEISVPPGESIHGVEVRWPSGADQSFEDVVPGESYLLIENSTEPFSMTFNPAN